MVENGHHRNLGDPYGSSPIRGSELKQVLTTTRERRSTIGKSKQFIVKVGLGNANSLTHEPYGCTSLKGAVYLPVRERNHRSMLRNGLHNNSSLTHQTLYGARLVSKSRMREIRLSGLVGGLPMQDILFMNAKGGLP